MATPMSLEDEVSNIRDEMSRNKDEISDIQKRIEKVESEITKAEKQLEEATKESDKQYFRREKEQLRSEKEQLRSEKEQLREKEKLLRTELREKETHFEVRKKMEEEEVPGILKLDDTAQRTSPSISPPASKVRKTTQDYLEAGPSTRSGTNTCMDTQRTSPSASPPARKTTYEARARARRARRARRAMARVAQARRAQENLTKLKVELTNPKVTEETCDIPSYKILVDTCSSLERCSLNNVIVYGPKGCGKTTSLMLFVNKLNADCVSAVFVDVAQKTNLEWIDALKELVTSISPIVLAIDNAQELNDDILKSLESITHHFKYTIAAYSPGGATQKAAKKFRKWRGDGKSDIVYFKPVSKEDAKTLLRVHGLSTQDDFDRVYYRTGGIPRYLIWNAQDKEELMQEELSTQFEAIKNDLKEGKLYDDIITSETTELGLPHHLVTLGVAYGENNAVHVASPFYLEWALRAQGVEIGSTSDWGQLERLAAIVLKCSQVTAVNKDDESIVIPQSTICYVQKSAGEIPELGRQVTLMVLVAGHPVVDLIVVDSRSRQIMLYFIQVSFSKYSNHTKKQEHLHQDKMPNSEKTVLSHYLKKLGCKKNRCYYVYATPEAHSKPRNCGTVYFLDLKHYICSRRFQ